MSGKKTNFGSLALCSSPDFGRNHEWILLFYKEKKKLAGDKALCDLSREEHLAWWSITWNIRPETDKEIRCQHPAPFPEKLVERLVKLLTYRRDLVVDPYNGSGTTTTVTSRLGRRYIGIDRSAVYCDLARRRTGAASSTAITATVLGDAAASKSPAQEPRQDPIAGHDTRGVSLQT